MTCIVASRQGWMASDSMATADFSATPCEFQKILNLGHTLIGFSGEGVLIQKMARILRRLSIQDTREALIEYLYENEAEAYALLVNRTGFLARYDGAGCELVLNQTQTTWAIGNGHEVAKGWLAAVKHRGFEPTEQDACEAIKYSSTICLGVNQECRVERL